MRKLGALVVGVLVLGGCGSEVAPRSGSTPSVSLGLRAIESSPRPGVVETPGATTPVPYPTTRLPSRPELPKSAYEKITVTRLQSPDVALRAPRAGYAQVIFACAYEEWSWQYEYDVLTNYNPPGRHWAGDKRGDQLSPVAGSEVGRALGSSADPLSDDWMARSYTEDSWPERELVTAYEVKRVNLTRAKVLAARNAYAKGCSVKYTAPLLDAVKVSVYAPWKWTI
ncbi:hypothetical protein EV649_2154 [Kribbella sp. VKM Ac-2569]|uniref:hypothetical protein n=1 Tax=Kribbella sp. VKM Ac-2569 TaxID=2512220 RepID=UPI00102B3B0F|nr:hypothetical protein [Kribbella sp. VKM Ac-2569]RZT28377.1 hypothetical protein EV649_2154 [Kribbella sp. VKM Ac-2569]